MDVIGRGFNKFHQQQANEAKLGAYYTDPEHCSWLGKLFRFPQDEDVCVLEPSAGNGLAVKLVTGTAQEKKDHVKIFAVEIDRNVADELRKDPNMEAVLDADFLKECIITNSAFSFVFGNPPYMTDLNFERSAGIKNERSEKVFLEKVSGYLKPGGIICWVIPHRVFIERNYMSYWMSRYETLGVYKFHDKEYAKWGQVAVIGKRRPANRGVYEADIVAMQERCELDKLDLVPFENMDEDKKIDVPPSSPKDIKNFRKKLFDVKAAMRYIDQNPSCVASLDQAIRKNTGIKEKDTTRIYTPPKKLSNQNLALLTACGIGNGYAGSVEDNNLHLQRGSVNIVIEKSIEESNGGNTGILTERRRSTTNIVLIESNGTITDLVKTELNGREEE